MEKTINVISDKVTVRAFWRGVPLEELTKNQLINAVIDLQVLHEDSISHLERQIRSSNYTPLTLTLPDNADSNALEKEEE